MVTFKEVYGLFLSNNYIVYTGLFSIVLLIISSIITTNNKWFKLIIYVSVLSSYLFGYFVGRLSEKNNGGL